MRCFVLEMTEVERSSKLARSMWGIWGLAVPLTRPPYWSLDYKQANDMEILSLGVFNLTGLWPVNLVHKPPLARVQATKC